MQASKFTLPYKVSTSTYIRPNFSQNFYGVLSGLTSPGDMRFGSPPWQPAAPRLHTLQPSADIWDCMVRVRVPLEQSERRFTPRNVLLVLPATSARVEAKQHLTAVTRLCGLT